ncbi:MAG: diphthamide synthesis protein [Nanoarchaeota archaeon]|jgi:diphthamide biosynthesis enzyme Dph1/Dph2-like protein|nr:diphthamide synthesis protein [Nanoarchaeota archaeon]
MVKTVFIGALSKREPDYEKIKELVSDIREKKIALLYSNQFLHVANKIAEKIDKDVIVKMQVLGCSNPKFPKEVEAILIIGQGKFHTVSIAYESKLPTYVLEENKIWRVPEEEIDKMVKKERGALLKYLMSDKIGILVTTKPGQMRLQRALEYKRALNDKKGYLFIDNHMDITQFENFGIDYWVNTACPRMDLTEGGLINLNKIPKDLIK